MCVCFWRSLSIPLSSRSDSVNMRVPKGDETLKQPKTGIFFLSLHPKRHKPCIIYTEREGVHYNTGDGRSRGIKKGTVAGRNVKVAALAERKRENETN